MKHQFNHIARTLVAGFVWLILCLPMMAQDLVVKEKLHVSQFDVISGENVKKDLNGNVCAVVKVQLPVAGVEFEGNVIASKYKVNEYWCWLTKGTKKFRIKCPGYKTLEINATDVEPQGLRSNICYAIELFAPPLDDDDAEPAELEVNVNNPVIQQLVKNMVYVKGGKFMMGATEEQKSYAKDDEKPPHVVSLADYRIGRYEVTQREWVAVMGSNPSKNNGDDLPVDNVRWTDCHDFIRKLNALTGLMFRLPTEAEWEYAARGGRKSQNNIYAGSNHCDDVAWTISNSAKKPHAVGTLAPNELGIYDMSGNVAERCEDEANFYDMTTRKAKAKRAGNILNKTLFGLAGKTVSETGLGGYAVRGGNWKDGPVSCRVSARGVDSLTGKDNRTGFRLAL